jgi:predicted RNA polymerase sigma factor
VPEPTIAQRLVRAKRTLAAKKVPFELPRGEDRDARLASVLEVIYLIFNEGYSATAGSSWLRLDLCEDALRLARMVAALSPTEPEALGLSALLEIQASRLRARIGTSGEAILLGDQNRALWDRLLIQRGLTALAAAERLSAAHGPYTLQAAIAACHVRAASVDDTDWQRIVDLYDEMLAIASSPVVELNRAVAVSRASGPQAGLDIVDRLARDSALARYHLLPGVRADLLVKIGRLDEAREEFERAAALTRNDAERALFMRRAEAIPRRS